MARRDPIGIIVLQPDDDNPNQGTIEFTSFQEPEEKNPERARMWASEDKWVTWMVQNNFDEHDITVTLIFDWEGADIPAFKKNILSAKVNDLSDSKGPGFKEIKAKVENNATERPYKYTIFADLNGLNRVDPVLVIDDGAGAVPPP